MWTCYWNSCSQEFFLVLCSADVGVFFCGPPTLSHTLHTLCDQYSTLQEGVKFYYNKENFWICRIMNIFILANRAEYCWLSVSVTSQLMLLNLRNVHTYRRKKITKCFCHWQTVPYTSLRDAGRQVRVKDRIVVCWLYNYIYITGYISSLFRERLPYIYNCVVTKSLAAKNLCLNVSSFEFQATRRSSLVLSS
jgi:hypothetical protein